MFEICVHKNGSWESYCIFNNACAAMNALLDTVAASNPGDGLNSAVVDCSTGEILLSVYNK